MNMQIIKQVARLQALRKQQQAAGQTLGFVPTMGALHEGHIELIKQSVRENDHTICSIFVNPTQFNEASDLDKYPRTLKADLEQLFEANCNLVFLPEVQEMYPADLPAVPKFEYGPLATTLEGSHRPGHFDGVIQVMHRFLSIVSADHVYMGLKDFQQQAIVEQLMRYTNIPTKLVACTTVREPDGLAMSSRNLRLTPEQRQIAPAIYQALTHAKASLERQSINIITTNAKRSLTAKGFKVDYFEIVDAESFQPIGIFNANRPTVACVAAFLGGIRLIDNILLTE